MPDPLWSPKLFLALAERAHCGEPARVRTSELLAWFQLPRRTSRTVRYLEDAFERAEVQCDPRVGDALLGEQLEFTSRRNPRANEPSPAPASGPTPPAPATEVPLPTFLAEHVERASALDRIDKRVTARLALVEDTLSYLCFALLALYRHPAAQRLEPGLSERTTALVERSVQPRPLTFGAWVELTWLLARASERLDDTLAVAARTLISPPKSGLLTRARFDAAVQLRNKIAHEAAPSTRDLSKAEAELAEQWKALRVALAPLLDADLCSVRKVSFGEGSTFRYALRVLRGGRFGARRDDFVSTERLDPGWAWLVRDGSPALRLAPGLYCDEDEVTGVARVFLCRTVALTPGAEVRAVERPTGEPRTLHVPRQ